MSSFGFPFTLYGEGDEEYDATATHSKLAEKMPEKEYWMQVKDSQERDPATGYQLYSDLDPFYTKVATVSTYRDRLPTAAWWETYKARRNPVEVKEQPVEVKEQTHYEPVKFLIGKQILMHLGGSQEYLSSIEEPEPMFDSIDGSGIGFQLSKEREKYMPELKRRDRFVPHKQTPDFVNVEGTDVELTPDMITLGPARSDLGHSNFCRQDLVTTLFGKKDLFQTVNEQLFGIVRRKANPYEKIGKTIFITRAAVKLANMDFLFNLTNSAIFNKPSVSDVPPESRRFYFADICAGPGGFTEYLYWRIGPDRARGFGMTLAGDHDWYSDDKFMVPIKGFVRHYGEDGTGNIFVIDNIMSFARKIKEDTHGEMVSLVTADGGVAVDGEENDQEKLLKRLVMCQYLCALCILRKGGNFLCKVFDLLTDFNASLLYVVAQCFERISIIKPYTSRPANSERYVCFLRLKEQHPDPVIELLSRTNDIFQDLDTDVEDVMSVFPISKIPQSFRDYLTKSNEKLAQQQMDGVDEFLTYAYVPDMEPLDQDDVTRRCLEEWKVPRTNKEKERYTSRRAPRQEEEQPIIYPRDGFVQVRRMPQSTEQEQPQKPTKAREEGKFSLLGKEINRVWEQLHNDTENSCMSRPILRRHPCADCPPTFFRFWDGTPETA